MDHAQSGKSALHLYDCLLSRKCSMSASQPFDLCCHASVSVRFLTLWLFTVTRVLQIIPQLFGCLPSGKCFRAPHNSLVAHCHASASEHSTTLVVYCHSSVSERFIFLWFFTVTRVCQSDSQYCGCPLLHKCFRVL